MSNDAIQPVDEISISKEMDEWVVEMEARLENPKMDSNSEKRPSIFGKWQCWDDFGVSFLPENEKWQSVACMTHCFGFNVRSYLEYMQEKVDLAWSFYDGVNEQFRAENRKRFTEHLLVNSCFLILAMIWLSKKEDLTGIWYEVVNKSNLPKGLTSNYFQNIKNTVVNYAVRVKSYMLTLNCQIPWFVVEAVYTELSSCSNKFSETPIHKIALSFLPTFPRVNTAKVDGGTIPKGGFKHLLHIFHWSRIPSGKYIVDTSGGIGHFHIPSATDLQLCQTIFEMDKGDSIDVSYYDRTLSGVMQLTPWYFSQFCTKLYESLLIFERECGYERTFTAYVACMSCLLKTERDVRVLRASGVIPNTTFDDKDVLRCVQELKTLIDDDLLMPNELEILADEVMAHYQRSVYKVYGEFKKRYCSNPWITISVIAGICLFILTFIQTILSFIQTKYSVLSYKKQ